MPTQSSGVDGKTRFVGNDRVLFGIGNGDTPMVHHPQFILNQGILSKGAAYWVALTEGYLR